MPQYDAPYLGEDEHAVLDHSGIPGVGGEGGAINWDDVVAENVNITATTGMVHLGADDNNSTLEINSDGIALSTERMGFFGSFPTTKPTAAVTVEDIHAALVALGLINGV